MRYLRRFVLALVACLCFCDGARGQAAPVQQGKPEDIAAIQDLISVYHQAVVHHDGEKLGTLFLAEGGTWLTVLNDEAYAAMKSKPKVRVGSYKDFAKYVTTTSAKLDPQHTNLSIHTDGTVAAIYFDFVFMVNDKVQNQGAETWQLVKTVDGWKIAALTFSASPPKP